MHITFSALKKEKENSYRMIPRIQYKTVVKGNSDLQSVYIESPESRQIGR